MRKNVERVLSAFVRRETHNEKTISTDGETIYSYRDPIAKRLGSYVFVYAPGQSTMTTNNHAAAIRDEFPNAITVYAGDLPYNQESTITAYQKWCVRKNIKTLPSELRTQVNKQTQDAWRIAWDWLVEHGIIEANELNLLSAEARKAFEAVRPCARRSRP